MDSAEDTVVPAKGKALVATDLSIACPPGTYGRVAPRSGLGMPSLLRHVLPSSPLRLFFLNASIQLLFCVLY